ncbi:hypothetical protein SPF06_19625 [Sinomonas sp. JGH33]|uniref:DUF4352 domain-containing protein n=1 Tax=Sinomonas terricola TaxID=3110330 RepID=A0ABU5TBH2_9MICC|nr:hypothetical protein [Sinomonas sp. JGH33]MEA5456938.1 hypothetical protein [Sinomonas sp. JGH33]
MSMSSTARNLAALMATVAMAATLAACADGQQLAAGSTPTSTSSNAPFSTTSTYVPGTTYSPPPPKPTPTPTPSKSPQKKVGDTITYENGLQFTVERTGEILGGQYAAPVEAIGRPVQLFKVTVVNNTAIQFDPSLFRITAVYGPESTEAKDVFDFDQNLSGLNMKGLLLPGKTQSATFGLALSAADLPSMVMTVRPDYSYQAIILTVS